MIFPADASHVLVVVADRGPRLVVQDAGPKLIVAPSIKAQLVGVSKPAAPVLTATQEKRSTVVSAQKPEHRVVLAGTRGPQGEMGLNGDGTLGGAQVEIAQLSDGDMLEYAAGRWVNTNKSTITDGGNF